MAAAPSASVTSRLETLVALARLLEKVDASATHVGADQYRALAGRLSELLRDDLPAEAVKKVVSVFPSTGELYENVHYAHAGLALAPLERAVRAEQAAVTAITRWRRQAA
jgi:hypothetical protein